MDELEKVILRVLESDEVYEAAKKEIARRLRAEEARKPRGKFLFGCKAGHMMRSEVNLVTNNPTKCPECEDDVFIWSYSQTATHGQSTREPSRQTH